MAGDLLAILLPLLVVLLTVAGLLAAVRNRRWLLPIASLLAMGLAAVAGPWLPADAGAVRAGAGVSVVGANVTGRLATVPALRTAAPDLLVVSELSDRVDADVRDYYPYRRYVFDGPLVGVYSRLPLGAAEPASAALPGVRVEVHGPAGPFVLYGLHIPRPWYSTGDGFQATPEEQYEIVSALAGRIAAERLPVLVVGDLNLPDRSRGYRQLLSEGKLVDAVRAGPTTYTSVARWRALLLRIDHVLVSAGWCGDGSHQFDLPRSDHRAVAATVGPCAEP